jgi:flagellar motility protein MotE (MotC chaperone)
MKLDFDRDILFYIAINMLCMLMNFCWLFMMYKHKEAVKEIQADFMAQADSLRVAELMNEIVDEIAQEDTLVIEKKPKERKRKPTPFDDIDESTLSPADLEFLKLQKLFYAMSHHDDEWEDDEEDEEEEEEIEVIVEPIIVINYQAIMDSSLVALRNKMDSSLYEKNTQLYSNEQRYQAQIGSLNDIITTYKNDTKYLNSNIQTKTKEIEDLNASQKVLITQIEELEDTITELENPVVEIPDMDYRQLAKICNGMDAKKVAKLMQQMETDQSVNVIKLMNQRQVSKVMAALPAKVAAQYSLKLAENRGG